MPAHHLTQLAGPPVTGGSLAHAPALAAIGASALKIPPPSLHTQATAPRRQRIKNPARTGFSDDLSQHLIAIIHATARLALRAA